MKIKIYSVAGAILDRLQDDFKVPDADVSEQSAETVDISEQHDQVQDEEVLDLSGIGEDFVVESLDVQEKVLPSKKVIRVHWSTEEVKEIKKYFDKHLTTKTTPGKMECLKAIGKSKQSGGVLHKRFYHTIIKKISNLNKK